MEIHPFIILINLGGFLKFSVMGDDSPFFKKVKRLKCNKIIKLLFQLVFSTYLPMDFLKFRVETLVGCKF